MSASPTVPGSASRLFPLALAAILGAALLTGSGCGFNNASDSTTQPVANFFSSELVVNEDEEEVNIGVVFSEPVPGDYNIIYAIRTLPTAADALGGVTPDSSSQGADWTLGEITTQGRLLIIPFKPEHDDLAENLEFVELTLQPTSSGFSIGSVDTMKIYIRDVPQPTTTAVTKLHR